MFRDAIQHGLAALLAEKCCFLGGRLFHERTDDTAQVGLLEVRFEQIVPSSTLNGIPGNLFVGGAADDKEGQMASGIEELVKNFQADAYGHVDIQDDGANSTCAGMAEGVGNIVGYMQGKIVGGNTNQNLGNKLGLCGIVRDQQNARFSFRFHASPNCAS